VVLVDLLCGFLARTEYLRSTACLSHIGLAEQFTLMVDRRDCTLVEGKYLKE
jgi:hypothetical protein